MCPAQVNLSENCYIVDWGDSIRLYSYHRSLLAWNKDSSDDKPLKTLFCGYTLNGYTATDFLQHCISDYTYIEQCHIRKFIKYLSESN